MSLEKLEYLAKKWEEEIVTAGNKTTLKPAHLKRLKKHIDKIYAMYSKIAMYEEKVNTWIEKV